MINEPTTNGFNLPKSAKKIGIVDAQTKDPKDMRFHLYTVKTKRMRAERQDRGEIAK